MGTCLVVVLSFYFMPKTPDSAHDVLAIWLQEFAWTEQSLPGRLARRNAYVAQAEALQKEPMFCLETAIKLCYWSHQVYFLEGEDTGWGTEAEEESGLNALQFAMSLYSLDRAEEMWDTDLDTKAVLAWGQGTLLIAFKGTSSTENIKTTLKLFKAVHPPKREVAVRGTLYAGHSVPRVHLGFLQAWAGNPDSDKGHTENGEGYRSRLLARVAEILAEMEAPAAAAAEGSPGEAPPFKIILTGAWAWRASGDVCFNDMDQRVGSMAPALGCRSFAGRQHGHAGCPGPGQGLPARPADGLHLWAAARGEPRLCAGVQPLRPPPLLRHQRPGELGAPACGPGCMLGRREGGPSGM